MIPAMVSTKDEEVTFGLRLTGPELKVTYTALHALLNDLTHDQADVLHIVHSVLNKLPDEHTMRAIRITD